MSALEPSGRAPGLLLGPGVELPEDVVVGGHVIIHAGVVIEPDCEIQDGAVLGKQPVLGPYTNTPAPAPDAETRLEAGARVGCYA